MKILKFGGTSVGSHDAIRAMLDVCASTYIDQKPFIAVVSAQSGVTNQLQSMARLAADGDEAYIDLLKELEKRHFSYIEQNLKGQHQSNAFLSIKKMLNDLEDILYGVSLLRECSKRAMDYIISHGERLNATLLTFLAQDKGLPASFFDTRDIIKTDSKHGYATVDFETTNQNIKRVFSDFKGIGIATGFIASNQRGITTTLGRGGSDYTASILGAGMDADVIEIWTDVNGVMTADPRKVKDAYSLPSLSYEEAMELSHFGAKVIYPPTLKPAFQKKIPICIRNTFNPAFPGTLINDRSETIQDEIVKGLTSINDIHLINIQGAGMVGVSGTSARVFDALGKSEINVVMITQASSEHTICLAVNPEHSEAAKSALEKHFKYELADGTLDPIIVEPNHSIIALIGDQMRNHPGIAGKMFSALAVNGVNIRAIAQGSSERNISVVIEQKQVVRGLNALHDRFFMKDTQTINMFMVGQGLVGKSLLQQMQDQHEYLKEHRRIKLNIVGLINRSKMVIHPDGIPIDQWKSFLENSLETADLESFIDKMKGINMPNTVFIDNTANVAIVDYYEDILQSNVHIVTPNKMATSSTYEVYTRLKQLATDKNILFLYETNVGAGLPVISTLRDLIQSGDEVLKIEGVFSGTLSYIFNKYNAEQSLASIVKQAQDLGYTEPDPREDLSGNDVARKLLILSREAGHALEADDIEMTPLLSEACMNAESVSAFYDLLENEEPHFAGLYRNAHSNHKKLRVIASLENGKAKVELKACEESSPFYGLNGSDNMIAYTTRRYNEQPLVVRGPGAGADVTAAGVFSDIIRTSKR